MCLLAVKRSTKGGYLRKYGTCEMVKITLQYFVLYKKYLNGDLFYGPLRF